MHRIPERVDSTFRFVLISARRAEQLMRGARPKVDASHGKLTRVALKEVSEDLVDWQYGPPPAPEPAAVEEGAAAIEEPAAP
jgi:DNA-directed RNA polymerase subunit omega